MIGIRFHALASQQPVEFNERICRNLSIGIDGGQSRRPFDEGRFAGKAKLSRLPRHQRAQCRL